jgi:hypothetical protein
MTGATVERAEKTWEGGGQGDVSMGILVRRRDFLACGISRWQYMKLLDCGALKPLHQLQGRGARKHLFTAEQLEGILKSWRPA